MAKLPVKPLKIFGSGIAPSGNIAVVGSLAQSAPAFSGDPATIQGLTAWLNGLAACLINTGGGAASPALEDFNGILYVLTYTLAYLKQAGIAEYDPTVTYYTGSFANEGGVLYVSRVDNNTGNDPVSSPTQWQTYASTLLGTSGPLLKAWVVFDGRDGAIDSSFNVASVSRTSAGTYVVNFAAAMADAFYGFAGTPGTRPGVPFLPGDDNYLAGGMPGRSPIRTTTQCQILCYDRPNTATEDSSLIAVQFFGNPV